MDMKWPRMDLHHQPPRPKLGALLIELQGYVHDEMDVRRRVPLPRGASSAPHRFDALSRWRSHRVTRFCRPAARLFTLRTISKMGRLGGFAPATTAFTEPDADCYTMVSITWIKWSPATVMLRAMQVKSLLHHFNACGGGNLGARVCRRPLAVFL